MAALLLVAALALSARQAPPPTIAEFAPQAVSQIAERSEETAAGRESSATETEQGDRMQQGEAVPQNAIDVARVRRCVGDPPRQIEDPQSPPCVPYWSGDNGGATTKGVTR